jgi:hypothetical protein
MQDVIIKMKMNRQQYQFDKKYAEVMQRKASRK